MSSALSPLASLPTFKAWNTLVSEAIDCLGSRGFPDALGASLRLLSPFQMMNGFIYSSDGRAFDLYNDKIVAERALIVDRYLAGAFVLDPFYDAIRTDSSERMIVMRELAPDDFSRTEYFRIHYATTAIVDEIGFVLRLNHGYTAVLSLSRTGRAAPFSEEDLQCLRSAAPLVCTLGSRHWRDAPALLLEIRNATPVSRIEHPRLTRRELEIVTLILKGHSNLSLAAVLGLSPNTVKVHRRQIYSKLNISSQGELFRLFLA